MTDMQAPVLTKPGSGVAGHLTRLRRARMRKRDQGIVYGGLDTSADPIVVDVVCGRIQDPEPDTQAAIPVKRVACLSDLQDLPGAGPSILWMLGRMGIRSQADLAKADPETLRAGLGVIGDMLDLDLWFALARGKAPSEAAS